MTDLQKERLREWVKALRSGEYKQAQGALHKGDAFCCLGVACDLALKKGYLAPEYQAGWNNDGLFGYFDEEYDEVRSEEGETLPPFVAEAFGLPDGDVLFESGDSAVDLNDSQDWSFSQIADALEEEFDLKEPSK